MNPPTQEEIAKALWNIGNNKSSCQDFLPWENVTGWIRQMMLNRAAVIQDLYEPFVKEHSGKECLEATGKLQSWEWKIVHDDLHGQLVRAKKAITSAIDELNYVIGSDESTGEGVFLGDLDRIVRDLRNWNDSNSQS